MATVQHTPDPISNIPTLPFRKPSQESSPPPSPNAHFEVKEQQSFDSDSNNQTVTFGAMSRPVHPGRQETPPSPPNSVVLGDGEVLIYSPENPGNAPKQQSSAAQTPHHSLKEKIARVFKGGPRNDHSERSSRSGWGTHKKDGSNSTNTTCNALASTNVQTATSSKTSLQDEPESGYTFYSVANAGSVSGSNALYGFGLQSPTKKKQVMNGGEVRIDILPPNATASKDNKGDGSSKYYDYYTRIQSSAPQSLFDDQSGPSQPDRYLTTRTNTDRTHSSVESRERTFVEDAIDRRFKDFHFGMSRDSSISDARDVRSTSPSAMARYPESGKPSSTILNVISDNDISDRSPSITRNVSRSNQSSRQKLNMEGNSRPILVNGQLVSPKGSESNSNEDGRRLSKISAGSRMSGVAIIVTADGPASSIRGASGDDASSGPRFTREEKGKGKCTSPVDPTPTLSDFDWEGGSGRSNHSDEDDSRSLLEKGISQSGLGKKLRAQMPGPGVMVHQGDPKYDFTYCMRQTSDESRILVPQYRYPPQLSFPNRNALMSPIRARQANDGDEALSTEFSNASETSILQRPPTAILSSPVVMPQGDDTYDCHITTADSCSSGDLGFRVHPALRPPNNNLQDPVEHIGGGFRVISGTARDDSIDGLRTLEGDGRGSALFTNRPQVPRQIHSYCMDSGHRFNSLQAHCPSRPREFLRRSLTPHLYNAHDILIDSERQASKRAAYCLRQKRVGRLFLCLCIFFPPLWIVMAFGGFDSFASSWTNGAIKEIGEHERKIALCLAVIVCIAAVTGVIVGSIVTAAAIA